MTPPKSPYLQPQGISWGPKPIEMKPLKIGIQWYPLCRGLSFKNQFYRTKYRCESSLGMRRPPNYIIYSCKQCAHGHPSESTMKNHMRTQHVSRSPFENYINWENIRRQFMWTMWIKNKPSLHPVNPPQSPWHTSLVNVHIAESCLTRILSWIRTWSSIQPQQVVQDVASQQARILTLIRTWEPKPLRNSLLCSSWPKHFSYGVGVFLPLARVEPQTNSFSNLREGL